MSTVQLNDVTKTALKKPYYRPINENQFKYQDLEGNNQILSIPNDSNKWELGYKILKNFEEFPEFKGLYENIMNNFENGEVPYEQVVDFFKDWRNKSHLEGRRKNFIEDSVLEKSLANVITQRLRTKDNRFLESLKPVNERKLKNGGNINKFQLGGNMDQQEQLVQIVKAFVAEKTGAKSEEEVNLIIAQLQQEGKLEQVAQQAIQWAQQKQAQMARHGAKLRYINSLKGICPQGQELKTFKVGGKICKKCVEKELKGDKLSNKFKADPNKKIMKSSCGSKVKK